MSKVYSVFATILGFLAFIASWIYAVSEWGFLLGVGLGWVPAFFIGLLVGLIGPFLLTIAGLALLVAFSMGFEL
jgi:uncharacterized membrane protein YeaQ/YmgE (transglycosylase-associated protein family)